MYLNNNLIRLAIRVRIRIRINFYTALTAIIKKIFIFKKLLVAVQDETGHKKFDKGWMLLRKG